MFKKIKHFRILVPIVFILAFNSCTFESNRIVFSNDLENLFGWANTNSITDTVSHSGKYSCYVNSSSPYGFSYRAKFREISNKKIIKARISFYAYEEEAASKGSMVFEIRSPKNEITFWQSVKVFELVKPKEWSIVTREFELSTMNYQPDDELLVYPWGEGNSSTFFDDYLIEFYW